MAMQAPTPFAGADHGFDQAAFCNAFWVGCSTHVQGENDAGYHVMQSFIKNTTRTMEDLRAYYQER